MPTSISNIGEQASLRAQITETLRAAVISGDLKTGVVYSAPMLATEFGVSPTPVREAMIDLVKEGLIEAVKNKGFRVAEASVSEIRDMLELRLLIEVPTVKKIAETGLNEDQRNVLRPLAEATLQAAVGKDFLSHVTADMSFHCELLGYSGNQELVSIVRSLRSRSRLYGLDDKKKHVSLIESAYEHLELIDLISAKKAFEVETLMYKHISRVGTNWTPALDFPGV